MLFTIIGIILIWRIVVWFLRQLKIGCYDDRYVFITGCDSGFGNLLAKRLDQLGFHVFAGCLTETGMEELETCCSSRLVAMTIDVTSDVSIRSAVDEVSAILPEGKGLWSVVNNAGVMGSVGPISWQTREDFDRTLAVNLYGVIFVTQAFLPLVKREKGRIVNISSVAGRVAIFPVYSVSKFGVEAFSDCLRREQYSQGVSVHILEPGYFKTELFTIPVVRKIMEAKVKSLPPEIASDLPDDVITRMLEAVEIARSRASSDLGKVVDAYVHAITAKFPKIRYVVGKDANTFGRFLWSAPTWVSDAIISRMILSRYKSEKAL